MASVDMIGAKLEAFEMRMEDRLRALITEFRLGRSPSRRRSQRDESSDRKENPPEKEEQATDSSYPRIRVDFPRWEDRDPAGWISHVERYFCYHKTSEASMVDIAVIHLGREVIQWYDWYKHTHGVPTWRQFNSGLLKLEIRCEVKVQQPYTLRVTISFARIHEERLNNDARRTKTMNRPVIVKPLASPIANRTSQPKELTREELRERSAKGLYWHCSETWSRDHRYKRGKLLVIESIEDPEPEDVDPKPEREDAEEEPQPAIGTIHALAGYANP
ncbi:hypothetical protein BHE74_00046739 [Ensete ventricosum]|nr:hypothetical protein BHE74_00046739 [Ensete ventricosum]